MTVEPDDLAICPLLATLPIEELSRLAAWSVPADFDPDERIATFDQPADRFHIVHTGKAAIEIETAGSPPLVIETLSVGDIVGVSWLVDPYRWTFDARAVEPTSTISVDTKRVRAECEARPAFGYEIYRLFARLLHDRLVATRIRALDLYR